MSTRYKVEGSAITVNSEFRMRLVFTTGSTVFPAGTKLSAEIKNETNGNTILYTLTTENGGLYIGDDDELDIAIPAEASRDWWYSRVHFTIFRTDVVPSVTTGITITIPVQRV